MSRSSGPRDTASRPGSFSKKYLYGCQFFDLTPEAETTIRKFVFSKQMEKLKKPEGAR